MKKTLTRSKTMDSDPTKLNNFIQRQSTILSFHHSTEFDYKAATKHLAKILKQCITAHTLDLDFLLNYFSAYNCEQRMLIVHDLEYEYNYNLIDMVLERPESPMRSCTLAMLIEPTELYARDFHDLLFWKQTGQADFDISRKLVEILLALNNNDTVKFKEMYNYLFQSSIEHDIELVQGDQIIVCKLLIELLKGKRYEVSNNCPSIAKNIARRLYEAGEGTPGIDYDTFIKIFSRDSFSQLSTIFDIYEDLFKRPIEEAIKREFQGQSETECFQDMVECIRSPGGYYSKVLRQAFEKIPMDYSSIIRTIIGHEEKDLEEIVLEYSKVYDQGLNQAIENHLDLEEIKRLFTRMVRKGVRNASNESGHHHFDHLNHSSSTAHGSTPGTPSLHEIRKNRSHDALNKLTHVFKTIRPH